MCPIPGNKYDRTLEKNKISRSRYWNCRGCGAPAPNQKRGREEGFSTADGKVQQIGRAAICKRETSHVLRRKRKEELKLTIQSHILVHGEERGKSSKKTVSGTVLPGVSGTEKRGGGRGAKGNKISFRSDARSSRKDRRCKGTSDGGRKLKDRRNQK